MQHKTDRYLAWYDRSQDKGAGPHGFDSWANNPECVFDKNGIVKNKCSGAEIGSSCELQFFTAGCTIMYPLYVANISVIRCK